MTRKLRTVAFVLLVGASSLGGERDRGLLLHVSDTHVPVAGCEKTLEAVAPLVSSADALVVTGDLTEFGGLESFARFEKMFEGTGALLALGNHDATWRSLHDAFFERHEELYSRAAGPFRLLLLDSTTCQDPRPHWDPAELEWIHGETSSGWLVPCFHHPPWSSEFASPWAAPLVHRGLVWTVSDDGEVQGGLGRHGRTPPPRAREPGRARARFAGCPRAPRLRRWPGWNRDGHR